MTKYEKMKLQHKCVHCGRQDERTIAGLTKCNECQAKHRAYIAKRKGSNKATCVKRATLCWECKHSVPSKKKETDCEWSLYRRPVPGWEARQSIRVYASGTRLESYCVMKCPKFERG